MEDAKYCRDCSSWLPLSAFTKATKTKSGLAPYCKDCNSVRYKWYYENNAEFIKNKSQKYRAENSEKAKKATRDWRKRNPQKIVDYSRSKRADQYEADRRYRERNIDLVRSRYAIRRAIKSKSYIFADKEKIREFYRLAEILTKETGIPHEVDHIIPLRGKLVCGLHCEANLQVLPRSINRSKSNRFSPDCETEGIN